MTHRLTSLLLAALACSLSACAPKAQPPAQPAKVPAQHTAPKPSPKTASTTPGLQEALAAAADLFNRGENDLACEQVRRAEGVKGSNSSADAALIQQLNNYRQACEANE